MAVIVTMTMSVFMVVSVSVLMVVVMVVVVVMVMAVIVSVVMTSFTMSRAFLAVKMNVATFTRVKNLDVDKVEDQRQASDNKHERATRRVFFEEAFGGLVEKPDSKDPDREDRTEGTNNLHTMVTECVLIVSMALSDF